MPPRAVCSEQAQRSRAVNEGVSFLQAQRQRFATDAFCPRLVVRRCLSPEGFAFMHAVAGGCDAFDAAPAQARFGGDSAHFVLRMPRPAVITEDGIGHGGSYPRDVRRSLWSGMILTRL